MTNKVIFFMINLKKYNLWGGIKVYSTPRFQFTFNVIIYTHAKAKKT